MARMLALVHNAPVKVCRTWHEWLEDMLRTAEHNMRNNVLDPSEFSEQSPAEMLTWLKENKPAPGKIGLIHGDWRPKNIIWDDSIIALIDWAFCDLGDPWYDLAIGLWYLTPKEREVFFNNYTLHPDPARELYYDRLARFTSV